LLNFLNKYSQKKNFFQEEKFFIIFFFFYKYLFKESQQKFFWYFSLIFIEIFNFIYIFYVDVREGILGGKIKK
jgi:hypothetical protein